MRLIGEARHRVVRLRRQPGAGDPSRCHGLEDREASAAEEAVHQRGDEDGLAGAGQPGDAKTHGRLEQALAVFDQRLRGQAGLLDNVGKDVCHPSRGRLSAARDARSRTGLEIG